MSEIGSLIISLKAETARFQQDLGKVKRDLNDLQGDASKTGESFNNIGEARGGLMLVEDAVGVRLPRHLNTLIAQIPGVGAAFAAMLPIAGVAVAIGIIGKLIERHNELEKAIRKSNQETADAVIKGNDEAKSLDLQNLKLQDQIAKLEHRPSHNYLREAMIETSLELDTLTAKFATDFEKMDDFLADQTGWWHRLGRVVKDAFSGEGQGGAHGGYGHTTEQLWDVQHAMEGVETARKKMALADPTDAKAQASAQADLREALVNQIAVLDTAIAKNGDYKDIVAKLRTEEAQTVTELNSVNKIIENGGLKRHVSGLEQGKDNLEPLKQEADYQRILASGIDAHNAALRKLAETQAQMNSVSAPAKTTGDVDANLNKTLEAIKEEYSAQVIAANDILATKKQVFDAEYAANADNKEKQREIEQQYKNEVQATEDAILQASVDADRKVVEANQRAAQQRLEIEKKLQESIKTLTTARIKEVESTQLEAIKTDEAANKQAEALGLETKQQALSKQIELINREKQIKLQAIQDEINAQQALINLANKNGNASDANTALAKKVQLQTQLNALTSQYNVQLKGVETELTKMHSSWGNYFAQMKTQTLDLSTAIRQNLQQSLTQFTTSFGNSMAQCIVENKNLGQAVRQEAAHMLEAMISMLVQWLEKWIITHIMASVSGTSSMATQKTAAAALAGANMVASWAAAPWPIDAAAPAMGAEAMAAALSFEIGGKIPGSSGPVPIMGHAGETVVTKSLTDRVERAEAWGGKSGQQQHTWNFNPTIHAMDAEGVDRVLAKHSTTFQRHVASVMRKMNR